MVDMEHLKVREDDIAAESLEDELAEQESSTAIQPLPIIDLVDTASGHDQMLNYIVGAGKRSDVIVEEISGEGIHGGFHGVMSGSKL